MTKRELSKEIASKWDEMRNDDKTAAELRKILEEQVSIDCVLTGYDLLWIHNGLRASIGYDIAVNSEYANRILKIEKLLSDCNIPFKTLFPKKS